MSHRIGPHNERNRANRKKKVKYPTMRLIVPGTKTPKARKRSKPVEGVE